MEELLKSLIYIQQNLNAPKGQYNNFGKFNYRSLEDIEAAIEKYSEIVDHIQFTELDIRLNREMGGQLNMNRQGEELTPERKKMFEDKYTGFFEILRRHADVIDVVTFWNVTDADSWVGVSNYPLLFDRDANPKDVYYKIVNFTPTQKEKDDKSMSKVLVSVFIFNSYL